MANIRLEGTGEFYTVILSPEEFAVIQDSLRKNKEYIEESRVVDLLYDFHVSSPPLTFKRP